MNTIPSHNIDGNFPKEGWHSRGYLPHCEAKNLQFISFRLYDSVPKEVILRWKEQLANERDFEQSSKLLKLLDQYEDAGKGACYLNDERIAKLVQNALLFHDGKRETIQIIELVHYAQPCSCSHIEKQRDYTFQYFA